MLTKNLDLLVILGATASGKTHLAVQLAQRFKGEVLSADSRQVYRGLDIGSGKDLDEYGDTPYHLIDIVEPTDEYSVYHFQRDFFRAQQTILQRGQLPIMAGGTGLYIEAVLKGYRFVEVPHNLELREELADRSIGQLQERLQAVKAAQGKRLHNDTDLQVRERLLRALEIAEGEDALRASMPPLPKINPYLIGIRWERPVLRQRITERLKARLQQGLLEEVQGLLDAGVSAEKLNWCGLEYRMVCQHLLGELSYNDLFQKLNSAIHQFAKRQDTWFRGMQRRGWDIHWVEGAVDPEAEAVALLQPLLVGS